MQTTYPTPAPTRAPHPAYYLYPAKNICGIDTVRPSRSDKTQLQALRTEWLYMQQVKEEYLSKIVLKGMSATQRAEAETRLAMLTGEIKALDSRINALRFRLPIAPEQSAYPFEFYIRKQAEQLTTDARYKVNSSELRLAEAKEENISLRKKISFLTLRIKDFKKL